MRILGIETSCDETAAAVVTNGISVESNVIASSLKEHAKYGGIIPEIASRRQLECINAVVDQALDQANCTLKKIDAIAVTEKPGLIGSLLVGISFARALSKTLNIKYIPVDHIKAHLYANFLNATGKNKPTLPAIGLVVSGGHTVLYYVKDFHSYKVVGQTRDDAVGEAYDKVARVLELGYPGGPVIDKLARQIKHSDIQFTSAALPGTLDFSFSGIKTAVLYYHRDHAAEKDYSTSNVAHAFQKSVVDILVKKCIMAAKKYKCNTLLVGGGVAANSQLRSQLDDSCKENNINVYTPELTFCTDNAAMIAGLGYHNK